jgi:prophage regulatory protein
MTPMIRMPEVARTTSLSKSTIYDLIKANKFPRPKRLGKRAVGWLANDIQSWIESRPLGGKWGMSDD